MNGKFIFILTLFFLSICGNVSAQLQESIHESFDIEDSEKITIDIAGEYEVVKWAGNAIMTHTMIELSDATPAILRYYVGAGRYKIIGSVEGGVYSLTSKDKKRVPIRYKELECYEYTTVKIFVPDSFVQVNERTLLYKEDDDPFGEKSNR